MSKEQLQRVLTECFDPSVPDDLLAIITIILMYSGLLRQSEVHAIEVKDVKVDRRAKSVAVDFKHETKFRSRGFGFMVPKQAFPWFDSYIRQLAKSKNSKVPLGKTQFLKNFNKTTKRRYQNMGRDRHNTILRRIEAFLGLEEKSLTAHCYRRSAATELANSGISLLGLKRAGRWRTLQSAEEYLEHSLPVQRDRMMRLDTSIETGEINNETPTPPAINSSSRVQNSPSKDQPPSSKARPENLPFNSGNSATEMKQSLGPTFQNCTFVLGPGMAAGIPGFPVSMLPNGLPGIPTASQQSEYLPPLATPTSIPSKNISQNSIWDTIPDSAFASIDHEIIQKTSSYYAKNKSRTPPTRTNPNFVRKVQENTPIRKIPPPNPYKNKTNVTSNYSGRKAWTSHQNPTQKSPIAHRNPPPRQNTTHNHYFTPPSPNINIRRPNKNQMGHIRTPTQNILRQQRNPNWKPNQQNNVQLRHNATNTVAVPPSNTNHYNYHRHARSQITRHHQTSTEHNKPTTTYVPNRIPRHNQNATVHNNATTTYVPQHTVCGSPANPHAYEYNCSTPNHMPRHQQNMMPPPTNPVNFDTIPDSIFMSIPIPQQANTPRKKQRVVRNPYKK